MGVAGGRCLYAEVSQPRSSLAGGEIAELQQFGTAVTGFDAHAAAPVFAEIVRAKFYPRDQGGGELGFIRLGADALHQNCEVLRIERDRGAICCKVGTLLLRHRAYQVPLAIS